MIQNLLDIFAHIVSADFNAKWDYYSDLSDILNAKGIISVEQKKILNKMIGFRNRLSHEYLSLDLDIVNKHISDFNRFLMVVKNYCNIS